MENQTLLSKFTNNRSFNKRYKKIRDYHSVLKVGISFFFFFVLAATVQAANFTSVTNGDWNSASTWNQNRAPDIDNWPNDKVIINHSITKSGNLIMNGSTSSVTINGGGSLAVSGTFLVGSGKVIMASGSAMSGNVIKLNTSGNQVMNGTITSNGTMEIDGHFTGSPTIVCGGNLLLGAQNMNQLFTALDMQVAGNMTVQNVKLTWTSGTVTVGGNFILQGSGDVDVPTGGSLDISGTLAVTNLLSIDGPTGSGSGGVVSWGVGNVILTGNNLGLNNCPLPYASPFDLSTCSQASGSDVTAPVITLTGNVTENVTFGATYTDAGATATDDTDGNLTSSIATTNNVDVNTVGSYTVTYNVSDAAGNSATGVVRTVNVLAECSLTFEDIATAAGIDDADDNWAVSWGDFNNDCYEDLFIASYDPLNPNLLYKNNGNGTFTKMSSSAGGIVTKVGDYVAGTWGDYDNDGLLDIAISGNLSTSSEIYHNNGDETFTSITASSIGYNNSYAHGISFTDYNNDGYLDLYITNYFSTGFNHFFTNDKSGSFDREEVSVLANAASSSVSSSWVDYDNDGDQDVFIVNTNNEKNLLYRNDGNGVFTKITSGDIVNDQSRSVGASWGDYDNDGYVDLFVCNANQNNALYKNNAGTSFTKITSGVVVNDGGHSHGSAWVDYDNDGYLDLYVSNDQNTADFLYKNDGTGSFTKETLFDSYKYNTMGVAWADYDNDGDLDLAVANHTNQSNVLFNNVQTVSCANNSLTIKLNGDGTGIGARLSAKATHWQYRQVSAQTGGGVGGQSSLKPTFGFGDATMVDSLVISWPNGATTVLTNIDLTAVNATCYEVTMPSTATVSGNAFYDLDGDCLKGVDESYVSNIQIQNESNEVITATNDDGYYNFSVEVGVYNLTMKDHDLWAISNVCSSSLSGNAVTLGETYGGNSFPIQPNCSLPNLETTITTTAQRIGFHNDLSLIVANNGGGVATNVIVTMTLDSGVEYISATPVPTSVIGSVLVWNVSEMDLNEILRFTITDSVKVGSMPGDEMIFCSSVDADQDLCEEVNVCLSDSCVGSFDPNDMILMSPGYGPRHIINKDEIVSYKIRFQNVGNWWASDVVIIDSLATYINTATIHNVRATHAYSWSVDVNGVLTINFNNINLPDSTRDEPGSHGVFEFSAFLKTTVDDNIIVENKADIYFDFNSPIQTNTVFNSVEDMNLLFSKNTIELLNFPNPAASSVVLVFRNHEDYLVPINIAKVRVLAEDGAIVIDTEDPDTCSMFVNDLNTMTEDFSVLEKSKPYSMSVTRMHIGGLADGLYIIIVWDEYGNVYTAKQIISH